MHRKEESLIMARSNFIVRGGFDCSEITKGLNSLQQQMKGFQSGFKKTIKRFGIMFGAFSLGKFVKNSLNEAGELKSAYTGLESILSGQGRSFASANKFINDYINDGLIPLTDAITAYKNLAARGYGDEQIQTVMSRLKDAAAFGRQSAYTLGEAVKTATEGLKNENSVLVDNAGVTKNVSKMWQDYAKSIGKTRDQLTQQEKIQAEVNGIIEETKFQVGDAAKYADEYAGRLSALGKILRDIKINLGNAFMPIANIVIPLLSSLARSISAVTATLAQFSQALFGKGTKEQTKATQKKVTAMEDLGDATEKAGKQAKGAVAGFDEINQLNLSAVSGDSSSVASGTANLMPVDDGTGGIMEEVSSKATELGEKIKKAFIPVGESLGKVKDALGNLGDAVKKLGDIVRSNPEIARFFEDLKTFTKNIGAGSVLILTGALEGLAGVINLVAGMLSGDFETSLLGVEQIVSGVFDTITGIVTPFFPDFAEKMKQFKNNFSEKWASLKDEVKKYGDSTKLEALDFAMFIRDKVTEIWGELKTNTANKWNEITSNLKKSLEDMKVNTVIKFSEIRDSIKTKLDETAENTKSTITQTWDDMKTKTTNKWNEIKKEFKGIVDYVKNIFTPDWKKAWGGVKDIFGGIFDSLVGIVKVPLNLIIGAVNKVIKGLNKINIDVPSWVGKIPGIPDNISSFGFNIKEIPKLARGTIIDRPTVAMLGEAGSEAVVPLENTGFVDAIATAVGNAVLGAMQFNTGSSSSDTREVILSIDGTKLGRAILPKLNQESERLGYKTILQTT